MTRRTTIEIDEELVERAREALGETTTRGTVEEALRRVADAAHPGRRAANQRRYLQQLAERVDMSVLASEEMWAVRGWLLDKSAAARSTQERVAQQLAELTGSLFLCPVGALEQLYSRATRSFRFRPTC